MSHKLNNLEQFSELRAILKKNRTNSPFVVEFTGLPKSGKTTILDRLSNILESQRLNVLKVEEAASEKVASEYRSDLFIFNMLCAIENLKNLLKAHTRKGDFDVILLDRGIYDSIVWTEFLSLSGLLPDSAKGAIQKFLALEQWFSKVDMLVKVSVDRATYEERSRVNQPLPDQPLRFNQNYFERLNSAYELIESKLITPSGRKALPPKMSSFDTSVAKGKLEACVLAESNKLYSDIAVSLANEVASGMIKKSVERIAVVEAQWFNSTYDDNFDENAVKRYANLIFGRRTKSLYDRNRYDPSFSPKVKYVERESAENDPSLVQIVSAAYITKDNKYLVLKRSNEEKREELRGKSTLIVSGHVDYEDQTLACGGDTEIENCLLREMGEELQHFDRPSICPKFAFRMGDSEMGKRHFAFIFNVTTNSERVEPVGLPGTGDYESTVRWLNKAELIGLIDDFDPWSQLVINRIYVEQEK